MGNLSFSLIIIFSGLTFGYLIKQTVEAGLIRLPFSLASLTRVCRDVGIMGLIPTAFMLAIWVMEFGDNTLLALPFICLFALMIGGALGYFLGVFKQRSNPDRAVLSVCSSFSNIGAMGSLVVYLFLGEAGFALVTFYRLFEEIFYFMVGYPAVELIAGKAHPKLRVGARLLRVLKQPFLISILIAFALGLSLNLSDIQRPALLDSANDLVIPLGTFVLLVSVGLGLNIKSIGQHLKPALQVAALRVTLVPLLTVSLAWLVGLGDVSGGLALGVILILTSMPPAVNSVVATAYYGLNVDLANSIWIVSTVSMVLVVPWLYFATQYLQLG